MATWMTHFRIAEKLIGQGLFVEKEGFLVGNIGPDCGSPSKPGYNPPKMVTHFKKNNMINPEIFFCEYLLDTNLNFTNKQNAFYLGYYAHLITDVKWSKLYQEKKKEQVYQEILGTPEYSKLIKNARYGVDFDYLRNHNKNIFIDVFQHINDFPDGYLPFFPNGQISIQIRRITDFYLNNTIDSSHVFKYLSIDEVDNFVDVTTDVIKEIIDKRFYIKGS